MIEQFTDQSIILAREQAAERSACAYAAKYGPTRIQTGQSLRFLMIAAQSDSQTCQTVRLSANIWD